jgi:hypothetical protein
MTRGDQADNPEHALPDVHEHAHARKRRSAKKAPAQDRGSGSKKDAYIGVAVAVVALLVTSFFSLRQLENSTEALEQTRDALSVQLLVTTAESTERAVESFASGVGVRAVSKHLPARDQLRLNSTLRTVVAWRCSSIGNISSSRGSGASGGRPCDASGTWPDIKRRQGSKFWHATTLRTLPTTLRSCKGWCVARRTGHLLVGGRSY